MSATTFKGQVLYIARAPFVSGAERALLSTIRHLDREHVDPVVVLGHETAMQEHLHAMDVRTHLIPLAQRSRSGLLKWWRSLRALRRLVADMQPTVMHANDIPSSQAMSVIGKELRIPRVAHIRWGITAMEAGWWLRDGVDDVLCISQWVRDELGDLAGTPLAAARLHIVPDAVDWPAELADHAAAPASRLPQEGRLSLGFAGQLIESKGLDLVIEAMGKLPSITRPQLHIAGEDTQTGGRYKHQLQSLARERGVANDVHWLGFLDDVSKVYSRVDAVVCPSRLEPLGLVPLEAARFALPALANNLGGFRETIASCTTGLLIEPTVDAWAAALQSLPARDALHAWGVAAWYRTRLAYSPAVYQARLMDVYARASASN
jgi:glycosyltransferase involved in cell wall biosynthesis